MRAMMLGSTAIAVLILVMANLRNARTDVALVSLAIGIFWLAGQWRGLPGVNSGGFAAVVAMAGGTIGTGGAAVAALLALVMALIGWDLSQLQQQLTSLYQKEIDPVLLKRHLYRLMMVVSAGVIVPLAGLFIQVGLTMVWAILLGITITASLSIAINFFKRYEENS